MQTNKLLVNEMQGFCLAILKDTCIIFINAFNVAFAWSLIRQKRHANIRIAFGMDYCPKMFVNWYVQI